MHSEEDLGCGALFCVISMSFKTVCNSATLIDNTETELMARQSAGSPSGSPFRKCHRRGGFLLSPGLHIHLCKDPITGSAMVGVNSLKVIKRLSEVALRNVGKS